MTWRAIPTRPYGGSPNKVMAELFGKDGEDGGDCDCLPIEDPAAAAARSLCAEGRESNRNEQTELTLWPLNP
jgi:hypothetical protein